MTTNLCGLCSIEQGISYLPSLDIEARTTILATAAKTTLTQTFLNPPENGLIKELRYVFPLYDGASVVSFTCTIGDRTIIGQVKEQKKAAQDFKDAVNQGQRAALFKQLPNTSDVFTATIGNIPEGAKVIIQIEYIEELKHDAEVDGIRYTIPTSILPRYGDHPSEISNGYNYGTYEGRIQVTVDVVMAQTTFIQQVQSPSHPIAISIGTNSMEADAPPAMSKASASLSLGSAGLDKDFILQVVTKDVGIPKAILETHPTIPNQRALMATLVPKFSLPPQKPEIVFICDRSGSMDGSNITLAKSALRVFLKSLPVGVKFNICSFGRNYSFMWGKSQSYTKDNLETALEYVDAITANMGGTEMFEPIKATIENRYKDIPLEIMLLTDGAVWYHEKIFTYINEQVTTNKGAIRAFTLGVGRGVSHSLIEGVARSGNGFSQSVGEGEKMESKVVRMLKGALSPYVTDYTMEIRYSKANKDNNMDTDNEDGFVIVERVTDSLKVKMNITNKEEVSPQQDQNPVSLMKTSDNAGKETPASANDDTGEGKYSHLPPIPPPKLLQAPHTIPPLYAFNRTSVYLLMGPECNQMVPEKIILRGTSMHGPLELEIPVQALDTPGEMIHQLAAKKAIIDLEHGRGWISYAKNEQDVLIKSSFESQYDEIVERETVRLGVQFQVQGKWTSFIAVEACQGGNTTPLTPLEYKVEPMESASQKQPHLDPMVNTKGKVKSKRRRVLEVGKMVRRGCAAIRKDRSSTDQESYSSANRNSSDSSISSRGKHESESSSSGSSKLACRPVGSSRGRFLAAADFDAEDEDEPTPTPPLNETKLRILIDLQTFEGFWECDQSLLDCVDVTSAHSEKLVKDNDGWDHTIVATALAVIFLEKKLVDYKDTWELIVEKAKSWLEEQLGNDAIVLVLQEAEKLVLQV
ncbi:hypothetical protein BGZ49_007296 [Haplosporangium sp. Z 27]|nr:hypothetical protein BGZ49_007296 [Haplosporangium sp. Z 27]